MKKAPLVINQVVSGMTRHAVPAARAAFWVLAAALVARPSFAQQLSITNYVIVNSKQISTTQWQYTYKAAILNQGGPALTSATATLTNSVPNIVVVPGQNVLNFGPVAANSQVSAKNTFAINVNRTVAFKLTDLHWTYQTNVASVAPVANPGPNQTAVVGSAVTLNGSSSANPSGIGTLSYNWTFTGIPPASKTSLVNSGSAMPTFVMDVAGTYVIQLTVSNGTARSSAAVTVSSDIAPVANPGPNQSVSLGALVTLNGSKSSDTNGAALTYSWKFTSIPTGSAAKLNGANTVAPTFTADKPGSYVVQLTVNDGLQNSAPASVTISQNPPVTSTAPSQNNASLGAVQPSSSTTQTPQSSGSLGASSNSATQAQYPVTRNLTGQLVLSGTANLMQLAEAAAGLGGIPGQSLGAATSSQTQPAPLRPPVGWHPAPLGSQTPTGTGSVPMQSMSVGTANTFGMLGLTHYDQRNANGGNQFSVEPPNASIAIGNGMILEGVNNAVQVYSTAGTPLLPAVLSSNQVFGVSAAINRTTGVQGVFPTDMRVFFDQTLDRFFVIQRAQDNDVNGNEMDSSHLYMAVSQTGDPTGTYNIYVMVTTDAANGGCPCFPDYPQIGADQYGFYISTNEFNTFYNGFVDAQIFAIDKASLAANSTAPTILQFILTDQTGFEFAIQPVTTPINASYFLASGGLEYFVSTDSTADDSNLAVWAMTNTSSLATASPSVTLTRINTPILAYTFPGVATEMSGNLPYGSTLSPPGLVANLDGGDTRVLSAFYAGGRIYATFATEVADALGDNLVGGAYVILSPTFRNNVLAAPVLRQGYLLVQQNHLLRPAIAVGAQGQGAITMSLVGPNYFPSAAFVTINTYSTDTTVQVVAPGTAPEDGFTGYPDAGFPETGIARWGDYNSAAVGADGSIWMTTEFIPNSPRTPLANWGTFISQYIP
jgi:hypothetical protein